MPAGLLGVIAAGMVDLPSASDVCAVVTGAAHAAYLRRSLPRLLAAGLGQVVVAEADENDGYAWVEEQFRQVTRARARKGHPGGEAAARNRGAELASAPWLFFLDPRLDIPVNLFPRSARRSQPDCFFVPAPRPPELRDVLLLPRRDFEAVGGYDEVEMGAASSRLRRRLGWLGRPGLTFSSHRLGVFIGDDATAAHALRDDPQKEVRADGGYRMARQALAARGLHLDAAVLAHLHAQARIDVATGGFAFDAEPDAPAKPLAQPGARK